MLHGTSWNFQSEIFLDGCISPVALVFVQKSFPIEAGANEPATSILYHVMLFRWPCTVGQPSFTSGESPPITALSRGTFYRLPPTSRVQQLRAYSSPKWYMTLNSDRFSQKSPAFNVWQQANLLKNDSTATRFLWYFVLGKYLTTSLLQLCTSECFCGL